MSLLVIIEGDPLNTQRRRRSLFVVLTQMRIRPTRNMRHIAPFKEEEEEEAVFISVVNTNEDPPNAHQAQHRPVQATGAMSA